MMLQYSKMTRGISFHPDLYVPVRQSYWKALRSQGYSWVGITAYETGWHYGKYYNDPVRPTWCGVTSWIEGANREGLRTVTRGNYSAQMTQTALDNPSYLEEPILKQAERVAFAQTPSGLFAPKPYEMNAFQPVAEWAVPDTPENCQKIHAFYAYIVPKIRRILPLYTIVFQGPAWGHLPVGKWGMPPMVDANGVWSFQCYLPTDDPARIQATYTMLGAEKMMILESGVADRSDLTFEKEAVAAYTAKALPLKIPVAGWLDGVA